MPPKGKKDKQDEDNNVLRHCKVKKQIEEKVEEKNKEEEYVVRTLTTDEKENMKTQITLLEEHELLQLFHFIRMDNIKYSKKQDGILLNLKNANDEFIYKIYRYINRCISDREYQSLKFNTYK